MPIYEYACPKGHHFEEMQSFSAKTVLKCPKCGERAKRKISLASFHLKGSGWYSKDVQKKESKPVKSESAGKSAAPVTSTADTTKPDKPASSESAKPESTKSVSTKSESSTKSDKPKKSNKDK